MQLTLHTETGSEIAAEIRALRVRDFPAAFAAFERDEEWRLIALAAAPQDPPLPVGWPQTLRGDSYTVAVQEFQRENQAFFAYCARIAQNRLMRDPGALASMITAAGRGSAGGPSSPTLPSMAG